MKIYVLTDGYYSDYHIIGCTDKKDVADRLCMYLGCDVEEYDTDKFNNEWAIWKYSLREWKDDYGGDHREEEIMIMVEGENSLPVGTVWYLPNGYAVLVKADDEEHARKIGQDLIAQCKARLEGIA